MADNEPTSGPVMIDAGETISAIHSEMKGGTAAPGGQRVNQRFPLLVNPVTLKMSFRIAFKSVAFVALIFGQFRSTSSLQLHSR